MSALNPEEHGRVEHSESGSPFGWAEFNRVLSLLSHELQQPIRTVSSMAELLASRLGAGGDDRSNEALRLIRQGATQMQALVRDLLVYCRIAVRPAVCAEVPLAECVRSVCAERATRIEHAGVTITCGELPVVWGDREQLMQLVRELFDNALTFCRGENPWVKVSTTSTESGWQFTIQDNGIGIEPARQREIFELFRRLHASHEYPREYPGTGVGLAICERIAAAHSGSIRVASTPGVGSTFTVDIPGRSTIG